jgi:hypothetical protein
MKLSGLFAILAISLSTQAFANPIKSNCTPNQYKEIGDAVRDYEITAGAALQNEVLVILLGEMGFDCKAVVDLNSNGIPGTKYENYELYYAGNVYSIAIAQGGVEEPGLRTVSITKVGMSN